MRIPLAARVCLAWLLATAAPAMSRAAAPPTAPASRPAEEEIILAAQRDDLPRVKAMLDQGAQLANTADKSGLRPLHWAASNGNGEMIRLLLDRGADINAQSKWLMPYFGGLNHYYNGQQTPMLLAAARGHTAAARLLLEHGAHVEVQNQFGATPLDLAAGSGDAELIELLLARHAPLDPATRPATPGDLPLAVGARRWSVLRLAAESGSPAAIRVLLANRQSPTTRDADGQTPLHALVSFTDVGQNLAASGWTLAGYPPSDAAASPQKLARGDRTAAARLLIDAGADANATDGAGHAPLYYVRKSSPGLDLEKVLVENGAQLSLWDACKLGDAARIEQVLKQSPAAIDQPDPLQRTPLSLAANELNLPLLKLLLDHGAKVDPVTPMHGFGSEGVMNTIIQKNDLKLLDLVLEYRKQISDPVYVGALSYALNYGRDEIASKLLAHRGNLDLRGASGLMDRVAERPERIDMLRKLIAVGVRVDDGAGLGSAVAQANEVALRELLAASPGLLKKQPAKFNSLLFTCIWRQEWTERPAILKLLLESGLDVNARDQLGQTPLHAAAIRGSPRYVELLLAHGADINAKTNDGKTAMDLVAASHKVGPQREETEKLLKAALARRK